MLDTPWPLAATLALAAVFAWTASRGRAWARIAAGVLLALAVATGAAGSLITTTRERIRGLTRDLVRVTAAGDARALADLLADDARLYTFMGPADGEPRARILTRVAETLGSFRILEARVHQTQVHLDNERFARTHVEVTVQTEYAPNLSWWRVDWSREADGAWRVHSITPLAIAGVENPGPRR